MKQIACVTKPLAALMILLVTGPGCLIGNRIGLDISGTTDELQEQTVIPADGVRHKAKILMVDIGGVISSDSDQGLLGAYEPSLVEKVRAVVEKAEKDDDIKALLLRVDSPGGELTATDLIYNDLAKFKEENELPVVACFMKVAASGGYYVACVADEIVANPTTMTGSISVIGNFINIEELIDKIGVEHTAVKSGKLKDMGSLFRGMTEEEKAIFQNLIDTARDRFVHVVDEGRPDLDRGQVLKLADGRVYTAEQAEENGLVDKIGYLEDAFEDAKEMAGVKEASLVVYSYRGDTPHNIYSPTASSASGNPFGTSLQSQVAWYLLNLAQRDQISLLCLWNAGLMPAASLR